MSGFYCALVAGIVLLILLTGCAAHLSRPSALGEALRLHRVVPPRAVPAAALAVPLAEGTLGAGGCAALLGGHRPSLVLVLVLSGCLFALYAVYARHVTASGPGGPCGCSRDNLPMSHWVTRRAFALALLALTGATLAATGVPQPGGAALTTVLLAAPACSLLLWYLPAAMYQPAEGVASRWTSPPAP